MILKQDCPPNISGQQNYFLKVLRIEAPNEVPSFNNFKFSEFTVVIEQQYDFIIIKIPENLPLRPNTGYWIGYWCKIYNSDGSFEWQLNIPDYDDNGVQIARVSEYIEGKVSKISGYYTESGFSCCGNINQIPTVGGFTFSRVN